MIRKLYVIRDTVAMAAVSQIMMFPHDAVAVRSFSDIASDPQTNLSRHVDDHELMCIGELDDELCVILSTVARLVLTGTAWRAAQKPEEAP